ncbi:MAG: ribosome recycling factor [Lysobacteraceae bacterium]|nr:MAG: ribosome recycling factor [Xanthomonadaceae bacterium]
MVAQTAICRDVGIAVGTASTSSPQITIALHPPAGNKEKRLGTIGQDISRIQSEKVQKMTDDMISDVDRLLVDKEKEIMQV